jgi:hypothetical protein
LQHSWPVLPLLLLLPPLPVRLVWLLLGWCGCLQLCEE